MDVQFGVRLKFIIPNFRFSLASLQLHSGHGSSFVHVPSYRRKKARPVGFLNSSFYTSFFAVTTDPRDGQKLKSL
jgi:hypothetical protein